ncbi:AAA-like domain protein [Clostridium tepidiprofundi DSM 19306]|uniref:AAA-like domain protein n=1 Tax=Clostridium tepidiprofundi DSM 19306 TaxID=1121338 RepID=A0A151ASL9_9CLOT|nr:DUF87 domain-containing protein [Clostridium tepidiprofundi]KYH30639.1 AAA-like domain protein [Clostridium tepidiprofundi DSM 19306]
MRSRETEIGEVVSISGNVITVQLSNTVRSNMPIIDGIVYRVGQIGSFLKIPLGYENIYGIVTQIGAAAVPDKFITDYNQNFIDSENRQWLNMVLVGEQIGDNFERGVSQSPTIGDKVHIVTIKDLDIVYGVMDNNNSINVGNISISQSLNAKIDIDRMISRHCAILGSTGSGKSNAVGVILNAIATKNFNSARVLVIDPHGEYNSVLNGKSNVYKIRADSSNEEKELYIPFWALPFNELMSIFPGSISDQNIEYFRSEIVKAKKNLQKLII